MSKPLNALSEFDIGSTVTTILYGVLGRPDESLNLDHDLFENLGADSIDLMEIVAEIQKELKIEITEEEVEKWRTVGDVIDCVTAKFPPRFNQNDVDEIVAAAKQFGAGPGLTHKMGQFCLRSYGEPHSAEVLAMVIIGGWDEKWDLIHATRALIEFLHCRNRSRSHGWPTVISWRKDLPAESGLWWHWNGYNDCAPAVVNISYSGCSGKHFATMGQLGWKEPQDLEKLGGFWMPCPEPPTPKI